MTTIAVRSAKTVSVLGELARAGFSQEAFRRVHHMSDATITSHMDYCKKVRAFRVGGRNEKVYRRLVWVWKTYQEPGNTKSFIQLAVLAMSRIK